MFINKNDLEQFLKLINEKKIDLQKDIIQLKDYKDYWLSKQTDYNIDPDNTFILSKADWLYLKTLLDVENYFEDKELEKYWDAQIKLIIEARKDT